jgi:hypothetical protein
MSARSTLPAGVSMATYADEPMHVMEPCGCGYRSCEAVMVVSVEKPDRQRPWPLAGVRLANPTPLARKLIDLARKS